MSPRISQRQKIEQQAARVVEVLRPLAKMKGARPADQMKDAAGEVIALRRLFEYEGMPDWARRSQECIDTMYRVYREAGVPSDSEDGFQANLRYHIGNVLRDVAPAEDLKALGLDAAGPRARAVRARKEGPRPKPALAPVTEDGAPLDAVELVSAAIQALQVARSLGETDGVLPLLVRLQGEVTTMMAEVTSEASAAGPSRKELGALERALRAVPAPRR